LSFEFVLGQPFFTAVERRLFLSPNMLPYPCFLFGHNFTLQDSYEFFPADGLPPHPLELFSRPSVAEAFLYPFMHLLPDGRMFIFVGVKTLILVF
jgi:hypothetical protein